jgi:N-carbamoylputrescine amidase
MSPLRAASVQFNHLPGDKAANLKVIESFVREAAAQQVELVVFPEMCVTGYWHVRHLDRSAIVALAEEIPSGETTKILLKLSQELNISIGAGLIEQDSNGSLYNAYVVAMPDGTWARHRKLHTFISEHMDSGNTYTVFELPNGTAAGILICYDNNIIENVRMTALKGAEVLIAPHQTGGCDSRSPHGMKRIDPALWHARDEDPDAIRTACQGKDGRGWLMRWLPARAHDNGMFLIFSNGVGVDDDEVRTGNAMILDPYGRVLEETTSVENAMVIADLDPSLREWSTGVRWMKARRPELYQEIISPTGNEHDTRAVRFARNADEL